MEDRANKGYKNSARVIVFRFFMNNKSAKICYSTAIVTDEQDLEFVRPHMTYRLVAAPQHVKEKIGIKPGGAICQAQS